MTMDKPVDGTGAKLTAVQQAMLDALKIAPGASSPGVGAAALGGAAGTGGLTEADLQKGVAMRLGLKKLEGTVLAQFSGGLAELVKQGLVVKAGVGAAAKYRMKG